MHSYKHASVMIVSSSQKAADYLNGVLPQSEYYPVLSASTAGEAKRKMMDSPVDIMLINAPLKDDFGLQLAFDVSEGGNPTKYLCPKNFSRVRILTLK